MIRYHVERWIDRRWARVCSNLATVDIARNMQRSLARTLDTDINNLSILVEVVQ